jgi:hypothetical protein
MVFDPILNELIKGQRAGYHKPPEELKKRKTELIIKGYKIKSLPGISGSNAMKYPEQICQRYIHVYLYENTLQE